MSTKITYEDLFLLFLKNCNFDMHDDVAFDHAVKEHLHYASLGACKAIEFLQFKNIADSLGATIDYASYLQVTDTIKTRLFYLRQKGVPVEVKLSAFPVQQGSGTIPMNRDCMEAAVVHVVTARALDDELIEVRDVDGVPTEYYHYVGGA